MSFLSTMMVPSTWPNRPATLDIRWRIRKPTLEWTGSIR
jgi:hypothetical protein